MGPAAGAAGPRERVPAVLARVPRELAGLGAGAGDRRVRVRRQVGECHQAVGQRHGPAIDRRLGQVGERYRVSRVDPPAGRARLPVAAGVLAWEGEAVFGLVVVEAPAPKRRGDPAAEPHAQRVPGDLRSEDAVPARRSQRRIRARHVDLEGVGPGDDRRGDRSGRLRRGPPQRPGRGLRQHTGEGAGAEAPRLLRAVRRAGIPASDVGRTEDVLHRPAVQGEPRPGDRP